MPEGGKEQAELAAREAVGRAAKAEGEAAVLRAELAASGSLAAALVRAQFRASFLAR